LRLTKNKYGSYKLINLRQGDGFSIEVVNDNSKSKLTLGVTKDLASQAWNFNSNKDGTYRITCLWLGPEKSLGVVNDGKDNNEIALAPTGKISGQLWKLTKLTKRIQERVPQSGTPSVVDPFFIDSNFAYRLTTQWLGESKSLAVKGGMPMLTNSNELLDQYWKFVPASNGTYRVVNHQQLERSLDVINDGKNNQLTLSTSGNYTGQFWKLTPTDGGKFYRITSVWQGDGKSLDIVNDGKNNDKLILQPTGNFSGQLWKLSKQSSLPPAVQPSVVANKANNKLVSGAELLPGMKLTSTNGRYSLIQQQDGNLVLYNHVNTPLWASGMNGKSVQRCTMQPDGNLVQYLPYKVAAWASNTDGHEGAYLIVQDDGNVVIYGKDDQSLWATNTVEER
jgi:Ricin-type beta-trefoil lectin domain-like